MHLVWDEGPTTPEPIERSADGARRLAEIYAPPADRILVRAMMNTTVDGAVAGSDGTSGSLRNPDDSFAFGVLRALADAVLVGAGTVRAEDYSRVEGRADLLAPSRRPSGEALPVLAVATASGGIPPEADDRAGLILLVPAQELESVRARTSLAAEQVVAADSPQEMISALVSRGHRAIQLEGGPSLLGDFAAAGKIDELCFSVTHRTVGGTSPRVVDGPAHDQPWQLSTMLIGEQATLTRYRR